MAREVVFRQAGEDGSERHRLVDEGLAVGQQQGGDHRVELGFAQRCAKGAERLVDPSDTAVVLPVPRQPDAHPTQRLLTLITCTPKYSAKYRHIITGELIPQGERSAF